MLKLLRRLAAWTRACVRARTPEVLCETCGHPLTRNPACDECVRSSARVAELLIVTDVDMRSLEAFVCVENRVFRKARMDLRRPVSPGGRAGRLQ